MRTTAIIIILFFGFLPSSAKGISIRGTVEDATSYAKFPAVQVMLKGAVEMLAITDAFGMFEFKELEPGIYKLSVTVEGYSKYEQDIYLKDKKSALRDYPYIWVHLVKAGITVHSAADYTEFNQLISAINTSTNKARDVKRLLQFTEEKFSASDEQYFLAYNLAAAVYYSMRFFKEGIECANLAIDAHEKYFPASATHGALVVCYSTLVSLYSSLNLYDHAIAILESKRELFLTQSNKHTYYSMLGEFYSKVGLNKEAYEAANELKKILDSGETLSPFGLTEDIARTTALWGYYKILSDIYLNQYDWASQAAIQKSYTQAYKSYMYTLFVKPLELSKILDNRNVPDSVKRQIKEGQRFRSLSMSGANMMAILAHCKVNKLEEAKQYIEDDVDKAVYLLLTNNPAEAEQLIQTHIDRLNNEFANRKQYKDQLFSIEQYILQYAIRAKALQKKFTQAIADEKSILDEIERKFRSGFAFLTESEKKELMKDYTKQLDLHYSILLQAAEADKTKGFEILNKSLQTKGLILEYTKKQNEKLQTIADPALKDMIAKTKFLRSNMVSFNEIRMSDPSTRWNDSIAINAKRIANLEQAINQRLGNIDDFFTPVQWQDIQKKLQPTDIYIDIVRITRDNFLYDKPKIQYWAFVIKPGTMQPDFFMLNEGDAFENRGLRFYQNSIRNILEDTESYQIYWSKLGLAAKGSSRIYLASDGVYHLINPVTLRNPITGKYVLDESEVVRISSGRDLLSTSKVPVAMNSITLVGNPDFNMSRRGIEAKKALTYAPTEFEQPESKSRAGFTDLPGTEKELNLIEDQGANKGLQITSLEGRAATEANVKKIHETSVIHFATHGVFDQIHDRVDSYLKSKLILAGAADPEPFSFTDYQKYEDGLLTGYEVTQLNLNNTELTVLSACETGLGDLQAGEGVWGLQRAFQLAGSKAVLGSLWKINDETTVHFMNSFYAKWLSGSPLSEAYRTAMIETRKKFSHPYYWGAFVLLSN